MPSDLPLTTLVLPALGMALDALGRAEEAEGLRRAERLVRELAEASGERRVTLRAELAELTRGLGARLRALCPEDVLTDVDAERLARELARLAADTAPCAPEASP